MKRFVQIIVMIASLSASAQEGSLDSLRAFVQWWKTEGVVSMEARVGLMPYAQKDYSKSSLWFGDLLVVADGDIVHFKLGVGGQHVRLEASDISHKLWLVRVPVTLQLRLVNRPWCRLYVGGGVVFDHIVEHSFISHTPLYESADNPDIGRRIGMTLQVPLSWYVSVSSRMQLFAQAELGFRVMENHADPIGRNRWGNRTPEREVGFTMPLTLSAGISYTL